jgi:hypothetical protein
MADSDNNDDDQKVKDLLDPATRAELERWFSLPSFQEVGERKRPPRAEDDPDVIAVRDRRAKAIAAVDPKLVEEHRRRTDPPPDLVKFAVTIDVVVDPELPVMDPTMVDRLYTPVEPREVERPDDLSEAMQEVTPQAILRDLHRSEEMFGKQFEIVDAIAEGRVDASAVVAEVMGTRHTLPPPGPSASEQGRVAHAAARTERGKPWVNLLSLNLPNRRVTE